MKRFGVPSVTLAAVQGSWPHGSLRSESSHLGWIHQPGGQQWERNAVFSLLLTGLWRLCLSSSPGSGLGKLGIRGLIPPRILFFLASCGLLFRKGPSSNQPESTASFIWTRDAMKRETAVFFYITYLAAPPGWHWEGDAIGYGLGGAPAELEARPQSSALLYFIT